MDALIYEDTPLATYFEGQAAPYEISKELTPPPTPFAPQGLPKLQARIRKIRRSSPSIKPASSEQILEQFRYLIVASQILSDDAGPPKPAPECGSADTDPTTVRSAIITASIPIAAASILDWLRRRKNELTTASWTEVVVYILAVLSVVVSAIYLARRQYTKYLQRSSATDLSKLIADSHSLDNEANHALRFVQEVEVVARGYMLSETLPPISRLEDRQSIRRCQALRAELTRVLKSLTVLYAESHQLMQNHISLIDVQRYHDMYDISMVEYSDAIFLTTSPSDEPRDSLRDLRFLLRAHAIARKVLLCDLLAIKSTTGWEKLEQWVAIRRLVRVTSEESGSCSVALSAALQHEQWGEIQERPQGDTIASAVGSPVLSSDSAKLKAQMRRFDDVTGSIRALHAKVHILQEEITGLTCSNADDSVLAAAVSRHYDSLGTDIRALQCDWDRGKSSMLLHVDLDSRYSRCSSGPRSPVSPSPSLGGRTAVEGTPTEAWRTLNGEDASSRSSESTLFDEEIFEAVAKPRTNKRLSIGMSREEKIARFNEDRRKRATLQEQAETTTNMLRELQMVIKHRPRARSPSAPHPRMVSPRF